MTPDYRTTEQRADEVRAAALRAARRQEPGFAAALSRIAAELEARAELRRYLEVSRRRKAA